MNSPLLRALPLAIVLLLSAALAMGLLGRDPAQSTPSRMLGKTVEPFTLPLLGNAKASLSSTGWKGRVTFVNAFASWCVPCAAEHPALMKLARAGKADMVGLAWKDSPGNIEKWIAQRGNPYRIVGLDRKGASTVPLALSGVPETFILDKNGVIAFHYRSALDESMIDEVILPLIGRLDDGK